MKKYFSTLCGRFDIKSMNGDCVEHFKRRRAVQPTEALDSGSRHFFEKILQVKKEHEFIFIGKSKSKDR